MKKFVSVLKSYIGHTGAYFMFSTLVFVLVAEMLKSSTVNLPLIWSALTFGALVALCDLIFMFPYLRSYIAKTVVHGILTIASFAFAFIRVSGLIERGRTAIFAVLVFSVLYLILAVIRCVYHFVTTKKENEKKAYTNLYTPTNVD
ncbi:MAG: hypothetical protein IJA86_06160 [Clostridia bacterium]|nr:hypothetical protein [Clostridia bacterium]